MERLFAATAEDLALSGRDPLILSYWMLTIAGDALPWCKPKAGGSR